MPSDDKSSPSQSASDRPDQASRTRLVRRWMIGYLSILALLIVPATQGIFAPILVYLALTPFGLAIVRIQYALANRRKTSSEEAHEADWEQRSQAHGQMLAEAQQRYERAPSGRWRIYISVAHDLGGQALREQRYVEFNSDGTGIYEGMNAAGLATHIQVRFRFRPGSQPSTLQVEMIEPAVKDWHEVAYGFEIRAKGETTILMWFDSDNPLPEDIAEMWPFQGEFLRVGD